MNLTNILLTVLGLGFTVSTVGVIVMWVKGRKEDKAVEEGIIKEGLKQLKNAKATFDNAEVTIKDYFITAIEVDGAVYGSVKEAFLSENLKKKTTKDLFELESELEELREIKDARAQEVVEARNEDTEVKAEESHKKNYTFMDTDHDGKIYCYNACEVLLSPYVKVEIVAEKGGKRYISSVITCKEGINEGMFEYEYDLTDADSMKLFAQGVMNNKQYSQEASTIQVVLERIAKFNKMLDEGRVKWNKDKNKFILIPRLVEPAPVKEEQKVEEPTVEEEAKEVVQKQYDPAESLV